MTFRPVDLTVPWLAYWAALVALVVAVALLVAGWWRERAHRRYSARTERNVDIRVVEDTRRQRLVGWIALGLAAAAVAGGAWVHHTSLTALRENLAAKYGVVGVEHIRQTGQVLLVDLLHADGSVERDMEVIVDPTGEPFYGDDLLVDDGGGR